MSFENKRVTLVCGHYGSGKTTFSINYSLYLREKTDKEIQIADLDVVNPYFRSREHEEFLNKKNIKVVGTYLKQSGADLPAVSADVYTLFNNKDILGIVDLGGNSVGSLPFATFRDSVDLEETDVFFVLNANRPENASFDLALGHLINIEATLGLKITAIVNNTHLMNDTTIDDIYRGEEISELVSKEKNIPVIFSTAFYNDNIKNIKTKYDLFIMNYYINKMQSL